MQMYGYYQPYLSDTDDMAQEVAQWQIFLTLFWYAATTRMASHSLAVAFISVFDLYYVIDCYPVCRRTAINTALGSSNRAHWL